MAVDNEGFKYPLIDTNICINCKKCERICPSITNTTPKNDVGQSSYVAYSLDKNVRRNSSSGGVFYHIAIYVLGNNGVVFGATIKNKTVIHDFAQTQDELKKFIGSK